jgi:primosomal replication protein N
MTLLHLLVPVTEAFLHRQTPAGVTHRQGSVVADLAHDQRQRRPD